MAETTTLEKPTVDVTELLMRADVQKALIDVLEHLPKLAPVLVLAAKGVEAVRDAVTDPELMGGLEDLLLDKVKPLKSKASDVSSMVQEAKSRAERNTGYIGMFGLLRLLKDPTVQYALRFLQAFVDVASEHRAAAEKSGK
ncbi:hypothetical protein GCM10025857_28050 [Alicyclobacillus contaminans]|uniref:DUF1641 domain-containing protein n=1 Tax=Alicyclobacillus contaminans TaxID=392016 RepID=UPI000404904B|nr:DUF1641 domain-containing protein [Alicyclobacillus contaminans]GMA51448.1 hypothetical protein GCM10025857_28050 [Alicyclobacillus contaminans]